MKRVLFVVAAGLVGLLLGVGLSLAADAIAGGHLSEPVPLQIETDATRSPVPDASASDDHQGSKRHDGSDGGGPSASETPEPTGTHMTATPTTSQETNDDSHASGSGSPEGSSGEDD